MLETRDAQLPCEDLVVLCDIIKQLQGKWRFAIPLYSLKLVISCSKTWTNYWMLVASWAVFFCLLIDWIYFIVKFPLRFLPLMAILFTCIAFEYPAGYVSSAPEYNVKFLVMECICFGNKERMFSIQSEVTPNHIKLELKAVTNAFIYSFRVKRLKLFENSSSRDQILNWEFHIDFYHPGHQPKFLSDWL